MKFLLLAASLFAALPAHAGALPLREQARITDELVAERLDTLLPPLMQRTGIDMWLVVSREYNEDPVLKTMLPAEWLSARRRTILVFARDPHTGKVDKLAIARYNVGSAIRSAWDTQRFPDQWDALAELVRTRRPAKIGIDTSTDFGHADGLDHTDYVELMQKLPAEYRARVVSAEPLAVGWLETRSAREMQLYPYLVQQTHKLIDEGFSAAVVTPGVTTTRDVEWWFRQQIRERGFDTWFHPTVSIQRADAQATGETILPGDLLHVDIGITYLRLNTDVQQHAYVLKPGETAAVFRRRYVMPISTCSRSPGRIVSPVACASRCAFSSRARSACLRCASSAASRDSFTLSAPVRRSTFFCLLCSCFAWVTFFLSTRPAFSSCSASETMMSFRDDAKPAA
jgi:hypothetical protein